MMASVFPRVLDAAFADNLGTDIVTILVGPEEKKYTVHKDLITSQSDYFDKALNGGFREAGENTIHLEEDDPAAIALLIAWLYRSVIPGPASKSVFSDGAFPPSTTNIILPIGGSKAKFELYTEQDASRPFGAAVDITVFQSILAHRYYSKYSPEELRLADYKEGRKDVNSPESIDDEKDLRAPSSTFFNKHNRFGGGLFGNSGGLFASTSGGNNPPVPAPPASSLFGNPISSSISVFGRQPGWPSSGQTGQVPALASTQMQLVSPNRMFGSLPSVAPAALPGAGAQVSRLFGNQTCLASEESSVNTPNQAAQFQASSVSSGVQSGSSTSASYWRPPSIFDLPSAVTNSCSSTTNPPTLTGVGQNPFVQGVTVEFASSDSTSPPGGNNLAQTVTSALAARGENSNPSASDAIPDTTSVEEASKNSQDYDGAAGASSSTGSRHGSITLSDAVAGPSALIQTASSTGDQQSPKDAGSSEMVQATSSPGRQQHPTAPCSSSTAAQTTSSSGNKQSSTTSGGSTSQSTLPPASEQYPSTNPTNPGPFFSTCFHRPAGPMPMSSTLSSTPSSIGPVESANSIAFKPMPAPSPFANRNPDPFDFNTKPSPFTHTSSSHTTPDHQLALLNLTLFAETICWPVLYNAAITAYTLGEHSLNRPPPLEHITLIYERTHEESSLRVWAVDTLASFRGEVDMSGYMSLLVEYESFLEGVLRKLREGGRNASEQERGFDGAGGLRYKMMEHGKKNVFEKGKDKSKGLRFKKGF